MNQAPKQHFSLLHRDWKTSGGERGEAISTEVSFITSARETNHTSFKGLKEAWFQMILQDGLQSRVRAKITQKNAEKKGEGFNRSSIKIVSRGRKEPRADIVTEVAKKARKSRSHTTLSGDSQAYCA